MKNGFSVEADADIADVPRLMLVRGLMIHEKLVDHFISCLRDGGEDYDNFMGNAVRMVLKFIKSDDAKRMTSTEFGDDEIRRREAVKFIEGVYPIELRMCKWECEQGGCRWASTDARGYGKCRFMHTTKTDKWEVKGSGKAPRSRAGREDSRSDMSGFGDTSGMTPRERRNIARGEYGTAHGK